jgi:ribosomal protein L30/L7E
LRKGNATERTKGSSNKQRKTVNSLGIHSKTSGTTQNSTKPGKTKKFKEMQKYFEVEAALR